MVWLFYTEQFLFNVFIFTKSELPYYYDTYQCAPTMVPTPKMGTMATTPLAKTIPQLNEYKGDIDN